MLCVVLPTYLALIIAIGIAILTLALCGIDHEIFDVVASCLGGLIALLCLSEVFIVIPLCRKKQAMLDLENYDFSPYTPDDVETFSYSIQTEKYYFTPSPFDDDEGIVELSDGKSADDYFSQFAPERLKRIEELRAKGEFMPFIIFDFNDDYFNGTVEKRREGEYVTVTVTEKPEITFDTDGVHLGEKVFSYEQCEAYVFAEFAQPYACTSVSANIILSEECAVSFAFGTRIMSIIDKYKIALNNRELADFILGDPKRAFKLIGSKTKISENKLRRQRCNN